MGDCRILAGGAYLVVPTSDAKLRLKDDGCSQVVLEVATKGLRPRLPPGLGRRLTDLLDMCWQDDPLHRSPFPIILRALEEVARERPP